jgi:hypothetical protein
MVKKIVIGLLVSMMAAPMIPAMSMAGPRSHSYGHHRSYHRPSHGHYRHHHHGSNAWLWGLGGLALGSAIVATAVQTPPPQQVVYVEQPVYTPPPAAYSYPTQVAPGTCRWERNMLNRYGRIVFDQYGQPVKEYATGPCDYPPRW